MSIAIIIVHVIVCLLLILIVLLQAGKGAEMGAAFGGSSQTIFGPTGPRSLLEKLTAGAAIIFMLTSLSLAYLAAKGPQRSIFSGTPVTAPGAQTPAPGGQPPASQPGAPQGQPQPAPLGQPQPAPLGQPQPAPFPQGGPIPSAPPQR